MSRGRCELYASFGLRFLWPARLKSEAGAKKHPKKKACHFCNGMVASLLAAAVVAAIVRCELYAAKCRTLSEVSLLPQMLAFHLQG